MHNDREGMVTGVWGCLGNQEAERPHFSCKQEGGRGRERDESQSLPQVTYFLQKNYYFLKVSGTSQTAPPTGDEVLKQRNLWKTSLICWLCSDNQGDSFHLERCEYQMNNSNTLYKTQWNEKWGGYRAAPLRLWLRGDAAVKGHLGFCHVPVDHL